LVVIVESLHRLRLVGRAMLWRVSSHVCARCFGRILERDLHDGSVAARCADCAAESDGGGHLALCACSALPKGFRTRLQCVPNPRPSEEAPSQIVVTEVMP
jgi:hypothetical protein